MNIFQYILFFLVTVSIMSAQAKLDEFNWLQGNWTAEKWGGTAEEYWSASNGNSIIGMFRLVVGEKVKFTEHFILCEEEGKPILKLKHFDGNFASWEEKDEYVSFTYVESGQNYLQLEGIRYELLETDQLKVLLEIENDGVVETEEFLFNRM